MEKIGKFSNRANRIFINGSLQRLNMIFQRRCCYAQHYVGFTNCRT